MEIPDGVATLMVLAALVLPTSAPLPQGAPATPWTLTLRVSGGLAGSNREVRISDTGELVAVDHRRKVTTTGRVPPVTLADINARLAKLPSETSTTTSQCRDCLLYHLEFRTPSGSNVIESDDLRLAETPLAPLVNTLTRLLNEALSK